ncbi:uncharacterized protein MONOS_8615 [Monocercomonoides exilis]|uniref:uncharacterized protein n=1 Tax=Monocercomonoides exilis TaxID=2049356 RepID=UPI0035596817|nr:hypothetical protein MONOS_8615 [Monocercomonoides exilis]|eukprot:MONOS_8615.1-p1 / transcript=MONOS_8615.1 / gene=MONOS_8615 / organism=Monocercomonoides_exilis_PA203 / gene_product=unspecified product / transcript_product=unspecified product / location=Mono_scaffold00329:14960-15593(+) / protein_length=140 / sequence_SO=supercontig / SO=protein_coding / is_pseudo=false
MDFSDDTRYSEQSPLQNQGGSSSQGTFWHSTPFSFGTVCKSVGVLGCIFPFYQLMENRKRFHQQPSITFDNCFTSTFCMMCCEYSLHKSVAERFRIPINTMTTFLMSWFCGPCLIWQDAHELKEREEGVLVPTFQGDGGI